MQVQIARIYEQRGGRQSGFRVLVDRVWPRGISKERADIDEWCKDVAPSADLRHWFDHDPARFPEFRRRYFEELEASAYTPVFMKLLQKHQSVVLLYGAKDEIHNQAVVLKEYITKQS